MKRASFKWRHKKCIPICCSLRWNQNKLVSFIWQGFVKYTGERNHRSRMCVCSGMCLGAESRICTQFLLRTILYLDLNTEICNIISFVKFLPTRFLCIHPCPSFPIKYTDSIDLTCKIQWRRKCYCYFLFKHTFRFLFILFVQGKALIMNSKLYSKWIVIIIIYTFIFWSEEYRYDEPRRYKCDNNNNNDDGHGMC